LFEKIVIISINQERLIMMCQTELDLRQHIASRTRSKMHNINVNNLSVQNLFFPLHDAILFQEHGKSQAQDLQLGVVECKDYYSVLMNTKSQIDFDRFLQLHMLDNTEEDNDMSWECCKVVDYCKEKGDDHSSNHKCLVEWNDINKTKSWVNLSVSSLINPKPIISFARNNNLWIKCPFVTSLSTVGQTRQYILQG
jgi:hypothetical protein